MHRDGLYIVLFIAMLISSLVLLGFVLVHPLMAVGAAGCICGCVYFWILIDRENGAVNRNRMASQRRDSEFRRCNACMGPFGDREDGTACHIMNDHEHIGMVSMHHGQDCLAAGLGMLEKNASETNAKYVRAVHRIGGEAFQYDAVIDDGFWFEYSYEEKANRWTLAFLRRYVKNGGLTLVKFGGTDDPGESGRKYDSIPVLLPVTSDIVKDAVSRDDSYAKRLREARTKMEGDLAIRCGAIQQGMIMATYARETALTARIDSGPLAHAAGGRRRR